MVRIAVENDKKKGREKEVIERQRERTYRKLKVHYLHIQAPKRKNSRICQHVMSETLNMRLKLQNEK